jgi:hypothetical protein
VDDHIIGFAIDAFVAVEGMDEHALKDRNVIIEMLEQTPLRNAR